METTIKEILSDPVTGLVLKVEYQHKNSIGSAHSIIFTFDDSAEVLTPFEKLTEEEVIGWITQLRGEDYLLNFEPSNIEEVELNKDIPWN